MSRWHESPMEGRQRESRIAGVCEILLPKDG